MRECPVQLGGEEKLRIDRRYSLAPQLGHFRLQRTVKRGVDLGGIEESRQILQGMQLPPLHPRRIEDSFPIFIRPPRRADANGRVRGTLPRHTLRRTVCISRSHEQEAAGAKRERSTRWGN